MLAIFWAVPGDFFIVHMPVAEAAGPPPQFPNHQGRNSAYDRRDFVDFP